MQKLTELMCFDLADLIVHNKKKKHKWSALIGGIFLRKSSTQAMEQKFFFNFLLQYISMPLLYSAQYVLISNLHHNCEWT